MRIRSKLSVGVVGMFVVCGAAIGVASSSPAGAVSHSHHLSGCYPSLCKPQNFSAAIEPLAQLTFVCNDVTGAYKLTVKNVQVIESDHVTPWANLYVGFAVNNGGNDWQGPHYPVGMQLVQSSTNGLFDATASGTMPDPTVCANGPGGALYDESLATNSSTGALSIVGALV
jgi:hypothetical protein